MATTTNFGWTTPDDTALVKDGASAIRTLGSSIDTSMAGLKGGTTGQILSKTSATDMAFTWINNDQGDITAVTAGTGLTGGGTTGAVTVSLDSPVAATLGGTAQTTYATGDMIFASATNTLSKRSIGSTGQVLTVSGGVPTWAAPSSGSMTLLSTTSLSGTTTTVSSIDQTYENLYIEVLNLDLSTTVGNVYFRPNSLTTGWYGTALQLNGDTGGTNAIGQNNTEIAGGLRMMRANDGGQNIWAITIFNYASTTERKAAEMNFAYRGTVDSSNNVTHTAGQASGGYQTTSAISSFAVVSAGGSFSAGSIKIYGVK